jgi:transcriptional regulator with XRE-family HTH domain
MYPAAGLPSRDPTVIPLPTPHVRPLREPGPFGRLLRFWRGVHALSQEELALATGVSHRHVSFLENGRSRPGRSMVLALADVFGLAPQDRNTLLVAAGFAAEQAPVDLDSPGLGWLGKSLEHSLRALDPWPASVLDRHGNLHLVNRAWLSLYRSLVPPAALTGPLNSYRLYFSEEGLRPQLVDWEEVACRLLVTLQQEVLLSGEEAARELLDSLLAYPSIPADWRRRGAAIAHQHSFRVRLRRGDSVQVWLNTVNTVGATPYVGEPRLMIGLMTPEDLVPERSRAALLADDTLRHPLLPY